MDPNEGIPPLPPTLEGQSSTDATTAAFAELFAYQTTEPPTMPDGSPELIMTGSELIRQAVAEGADADAAAAAAGMVAAGSADPDGDTNMTSIQYGVMGINLGSSNASIETDDSNPWPDHNLLPAAMAALGGAAAGGFTSPVPDVFSPMMSPHSPGSASAASGESAIPITAVHPPRPKTELRGLHCFVHGCDAHTLRKRPATYDALWAGAGMAIRFCKAHFLMYTPPAGYKACRRCSKYVHLSGFPETGKTCLVCMEKDQNVRPCVLVVVQPDDARAMQPCTLYPTMTRMTQWAYAPCPLTCTLNSFGFTWFEVVPNPFRTGVSIVWPQGQLWPSHAVCQEGHLVYTSDPHREAHGPFKVMFVRRVVGGNDAQELAAAHRAAVRQYQQAKRGEDGTGPRGRGTRRGNNNGASASADYSASYNEGDVHFEQLAYELRDICDDLDIATRDVVNYWQYGMYSALSVAVLLNDYAGAEALLELGADPLQASPEGTAVDLCQDDRMTTLLRAYMEDPNDLFAAHAYVPDFAANPVLEELVSYLYKHPFATPELFDAPKPKLVVPQPAPPGTSPTSPASPEPPRKDPSGDEGSSVPPPSAATSLAEIQRLIIERPELMLKVFTLFALMPPEQVAEALDPNHKYNASRKPAAQPTSVQLMEVDVSGAAQPVRHPRQSGERAWQFAEACSKAFMELESKAKDERNAVLSFMRVQRAKQSDTDSTKSKPTVLILDLQLASSLAADSEARVESGPLTLAKLSDFLGMPAIEVETRIRRLYADVASEQWRLDMNALLLEHDLRLGSTVSLGDVCTALSCGQLPALDFVKSTAAARVDKKMHINGEELLKALASVMPPSMATELHGILGEHGAGDVVTGLRQVGKSLGLPPQLVAV